MVFNFLHNTHTRRIPLIITVRKFGTYATVINNSSLCSKLSDCNYDDSNSESDISIVNNENFSCGYFGEHLKSRTFSSDSENESNDRGG